MAAKNVSVFGIFPSNLAGESGAAALMDNGFDTANISVLLPDVPSAHEFAHIRATKAPEGASAGVTAGGVLGGLFGLLAGAGALALPVVGQIVAAGPIMAGLAGLGVGGAVGGMVGALIGMGIPEYEAKRYEGRVKDGGTLLSVHCDNADQVGLAKHILKTKGALDIAASGERRSEPIQVAII